MPVDTSKALDLRLNHNLTYEEIGAIEGVTKQAIHAALKGLLPAEDEVDSFKQYRADILAAAQVKMLKAWNDLTPDEQKDLVRRRGMVDYGILQDKEFQARGIQDNTSRPMIQINVTGNASVAVDNPVDNNNPNQIIDIQSP